MVAFFQVTNNHILNILEHKNVHWLLKSSKHCGFKLALGKSDKTHSFQRTMLGMGNSTKIQHIDDIQNGVFVGLISKSLHLAN